MKALLSNLKILDFTTLLPGPFATMYLADLGADVLRIESPSRPDLIRLMPPYVDENKKISCFHSYLNRNKKSIALDLKHKDSFVIIERLVKTYDVIVEQFRPGAMERLGLSYKRLSAINSKIIYCSLTGYGQNGPLSNRAGHDINFMSLSGIMSYSGKKECGPNLMGIQIADISGSYNTAISILAALINRMGAGKGQYIDVSMLDCLFPYHAISAIKELCGEAKVGYETELLNGGSLYDFYETADGEYLSFGGLEAKFFERFCDVLGIEELKEGGITQLSKLSDSKKKVVDLIRSKPRDYWIQKFKAADVCVEPILSFREAIDTDHAKERGLLVEVPCSQNENVTQIAHPVKYSDFKPVYKRCGAKLGEDTFEVMRSLGFSNDEIRNFKEKGVLGQDE